MQLSSRLYALLVLLYVYNVAAAPISDVNQIPSHGGEHSHPLQNVYPRGRGSRKSTTTIHIPEGYSGSVHITSSSGGSSNRPPRPPQRSFTSTGASGWHDSHHDTDGIPGVRYTSGNPPSSYRPVHDDPPAFQRRPSQSGPPPSGFRYSVPSRPAPQSDYRDSTSRYPPSTSNTRPGPPPPNYRPSTYHEPPPSPPPYRQRPEYESPPPSPIEPPRRSHTTSFGGGTQSEKDREREMEELLRPWGGKMPHAPMPPNAA